MTTMENPCSLTMSSYSEILQGPVLAESTSIEEQRGTYCGYCMYSPPKFCYALQQCSSWGADSNKEYPYQTLSPSMERFFTLDGESTACQSPFLAVQHSFLLKHPGGFKGACKQIALNMIQSSFDESRLSFFESTPYMIFICFKNWWILCM